MTIRPFAPADTASLLAGRDTESQRWLGHRSDDPRPTACIVVDGDIVGWVDYDVEREWLLPGEVNVGYNVFPQYRRRGYASRGVELLLQHLAEATAYDTATLVIDHGNASSLAVAARCDFTPAGEVNGSRYFKRSVGRR